MILLQIFLLTLFSYILVKIVIKYAHELRFLDIPNERSHHCDIIPSGAGLGFISAFFIMITLFEFELLLTNWYYFLSIFVVFIIGIIDDRFEVSARWKFIVIFFSVFILWLNGVSIDTLGIWFGYDLSFSWWIALPFSMFAIAGFTNALNLIDGIDGLSSSVSLVILFFFLFLGIEYHDNFIIKISLYTIATLIGFIILNWHPAKIFMGDSGSLTLGFIISVLALKSIEHIHPIGILYLAAIPLLDTLVVMVRRIRRGKSPFKPDKTHIHHILVKFFDMNVKKNSSIFSDSTDYI
jgi:UDP-GlcNAc:undecaprenyl-phosphate GlcNAc-1-phosphate transferase